MARRKDQRSGLAAVSAAVVRPESSYWHYVREIVAPYLSDNDAKQIDELFDEMTRAPLVRQDSIAAELFDAISRVPDCQTIGFRLGSATPITAFELSLRVAPTVRDLLRFVHRFCHLKPLTIYRFTERRVGGELTIGFRVPVTPSCEALLVSSIIVQVYREFGIRAGRRENGVRVQLTGSSEPLAAEYRRHLRGCVVEIGYPANTMYIDATVLSRANRFGDAETFRRVWASYEHLEMMNRLTPDPRKKAHDLLMANPMQPPMLAEIAESLGLSVRQLRLALGRAGTSYREIFRETRLAHARALFSDPSVSVSEVAFCLGYSDVAAFTHGLKRWTGLSPKAFRETLRT